MLIIEDGSGKVDANSYVSVDELRVFASARGLPLPSNDEDGDKQIEQKLILAADYLESEIQYAGDKYSDAQALSWPRRYAYISDKLFPYNAIPKNLKLAQMRLALAALEGVELQPVLSGNAEDYVTEEKVGPIETKYADPTKFSGRATFTAVDALLAPLLGSGTGFGTFTVVR